MGALRVSVDHRRDLVLVRVRGLVDDDPGALLRYGGVALRSAAARPLLVDLGGLRVQCGDGAAAVCELLRRRPRGVPAVVIARRSLRRQLSGVFDSETGWYPAGLRSPWTGMAASLSHRRRHLPAQSRTHPACDPLGELIWAAAREHAVAR